jgi:hypothetical protein
MVIHKVITSIQAGMVFSFFLILNVLTSGGHLDWRDGVETFIVTESMVTMGSAELHSDVASIRELYGRSYDQYNGTSAPPPYYPPRSLLLSAIAVPFYYAATALSLSPILVIGLFVNSVLIALTSLVVFAFSVEMYGSTKIAFLLGLIFNFSSFIWPYNTSLYPQPLQGLLVISSAYLIYRSEHLHRTFICSYSMFKINFICSSNWIASRLFYVIASSVLIGLSVLAHPSSIILIPGFIVYFVFTPVIFSRKVLIIFLLSLAVVILLVGLVNSMRFNSFTEFGYYGYGSITVHGGWEGVLGLLVSPGFGILLYFPPVILVPFAIRGLIRKKESRHIAFLVVYVSVATLLFFGTLSYDEPVSWSGAFAWGPRYMILLLPFFVVALGSLLRALGRRRVLQALAISVLFVSGFFVNIIGKLVWVSYVANYIWEKLELPTIAANYWSIVAWNPFYSPVILHLRVLTENFLSQIQPEYYYGTVNHYVNYGLLPCSYDLYLFCNFGIIPVLGTCGLAAVLGSLILMMQNNRRDFNTNGNY